tara:strand:- start:1647 stop:2018 length:372 start_codon:yes stop_codon:yes gene_type:complete
MSGAYAYTPYTNQSRSSGYDSAAVINNDMNRVNDTSNPPTTDNFYEKWGKYFGKPPFGDIQTDNYAMLGHESYTLPTAYIGWALVLIFVCMFLLCLLGFNHLAFFSKRTELAYRENAKCFNRF